jgi:hypothetical protein
MTGRVIDPSTGILIDSPTVGWAYFIRLDIDADPIIAWTGFGAYAFASNYPDAALAGKTFDGITHLVGEVSPVTEGQGGSEALMLTLPGVNMTDEAMRQVVYDRRRWQFRPAWVWVALLDATGAIVGAPIRLKSGRMDQMTVTEEDDGSGTVRCQIESAQSYQGEALATRYSEQKELDSTDLSQDYVWQLANMTPAIGEKTNLVASSPGYGGGYNNSPSYGRWNNFGQQ